MIKRIKLFGFLIMLVFFLGACKSHKNAQKNVDIKPQITEVDSVFKAMKSAEFQFDWLKGKFSGLYQVDDRKQNFSGQFRMRKDSLIWCSITVMNIEVARIMVTPDTVKLLNRLNKTYFVSNLDYINAQLNTDIDFDMLQSLLLGNDIPYYETDKFDLTNKNEIYQLSTIGRGKLKKYIKTDDDLSKVLIQKMNIDKNTNRIVQQNLRQLRNPNKKVIARYSEFQDVNGLFPTEIEFKFVGVKDIVINFNFNKLEKDIPLSFPFRVPSKYQRDLK